MWWSVSADDTNQKESIGLSCLPGFKQLTICNNYHCFVQYAKCISDEKTGEVLFPLASKYVTRFSMEANRVNPSVKSQPKEHSSIKQKEKEATTICEEASLFSVK